MPLFELDLVAVPGGTLVTGLTEVEARSLWESYADLGLPWQYFSKETGSLTVLVTSLLVQRCPVTWVELGELVPDAVDRHKPNHEAWTCPANRLTHLEATLAAERAAELTGTALRLPTEWEWEWVAGGGEGREYPWGPTFDPTCGNLVEAGEGRALPVGSFPNGASKHGLLDLVGNADEWTASVYAPLPGAHWTVPTTESWSGDKHVTRGGSWEHQRDLARVRRRHGLYRPWTGAGFRLVRDA